MAEPLRHAGRRLWHGRRANFLIVAPLLFVAAFFLHPMAGMLSRSFTEGAFPGALYLELANDSVFLLALRNTFMFATVTAAAAAILAYPVAILIGFARPGVAGLLLLLVMVPFWTSILVRSYAWLVLLGREGIVNSIWIGWGLGSNPLKLIFNDAGVIIAMVHVMLPYMILAVLSSMARLDKDLLTAASSLGATRWQAFVRVLFPLTFPGVAGGFALVFVLSLGFFITPAVMGGPRQIVAAIMIHDQITKQLAWDQAAAVSVVLLVLTGGTFLVCARILGLQRHMSLAVD
ncbi:MAG TPA: ABC transporter permease [Casimicrobiaceae bacterium]|nr:ABC transporter permease [Casimicrobiaceae bacterium]